MRHWVVRLALAAVAALGLVGIAACTSKESEAKLPEIAIGAADFSFTASQSIAGGLVKVKLTNNGKEAHHAQFIRLNDGVTQQQFSEALQKAAAENFAGPSMGQAMGMITFQGGPAPVGPGVVEEVTVDLPAGQYMLACFVAGADGVPHMAKGMMAAMTVTAGPATKPAAPAADATIEGVDFGFNGAPASVKAGTHMWAFKNMGKEPHEMGVIRLKAPVADVQKFFATPPGSAPAGPPPFEDAGGFQAIMPGSMGWPNLKLEKGEYALICFIPSGANRGAPHFALGMFKAFTVE